MRPSRGCSTFAWRWIVATTYERGSWGTGNAARASGAEEPARVGHDVADDVDSAENAFVLEYLLGAIVRAEQEPREAVGLDPRVLLGHRQIPAPQSRFDVCKRDRSVSGGARARERRVRVAVDEDEIRRLGGDPLRDRRLHSGDVRRVEVEAVPRLGEPELVEEHLGHDVEPVLPGMQDDLARRPRHAVPRRAELP